jgi:hypothetical protein
LARYRRLKLQRIDLADLAPKPRERPKSARQIAREERDAEIRAALDEAATLPTSQAVLIELADGHKIGTLRAAVSRVVQAEPRDLNWGVRGRYVVLSKGKIPGRRSSPR